MTNETASSFISGQLNPSLTKRVFVWSLCLLFTLWPGIKANAYVLLQPAQTVAGSEGSSQERAPKMGALEEGKPLEREMKGGESHSYQ
ncbi:MAG TPA: hypothetical protein VF735_04915 [Pyrinomonadaceae bacterium]|jgi:hypothetical protein